ncbi:MAG: MoaD/ThiS family protein [Aquisalinus sp.]|nr:MoaD/ThiS family protein [Aquisalinus sp.]
MQISYFGKLREQLKVASEEVALNDDLITAGDLRDWLAASHINGECLLANSVRVIIDDEVSTWEQNIRNAVTVAFIPPVSGG